jgi:glucosyl-3-phosphoglycerate phosphatase
VILIRHGQTEFNRVFSATRCDPGIRDPVLTPHGRRQASEVACALQGVRLSRLITSPYIRALETAEILAAHLNLPVTIDTLVAERFCFTCDIGSPVAELRARWPAVAFDRLRDPWWPQAEETAEMICLRSRLFRRQVLSENWRETAVVTHWGFIRALTGLTVPNGIILRIDPARPNHQPEMVFMADTG